MIDGVHDDGTGKCTVEMPPDPYRIPSLDDLRATAAEAASARLTPKQIVDKYLFADVGVLCGPGAASKTTLTLLEAIHIILGRPIYGLEICSPGPVTYVTAEDSREILLARAHRITDALGLDDDARACVYRNLYVHDMSAAPVRLSELDAQGNIQLTALADRFVDRFGAVGPSMVVIDPAVSFGPGERLVNDAEQSTITACRRIVRGLDCYVRLIHHSGKSNAREHTLDQYTARGGSALADGARMVTVLQPWTKECGHQPPAGVAAGPGVSVSMLARAKLSYAAPQPMIWVSRSGYDIRGLVEIATDHDTHLRACADQIVTFLRSELEIGRYHTKNTLEQAELMPRNSLRAALAELEVSHRVINDKLPDHIKRYGPRSYLKPETSPLEVGEVSSFNHKNESSADDTSLTGDFAAAYRGKVGGEVLPATNPIPTTNLAGEVVAKYGEVGEVSDREAAVHDSPSARDRGVI